MLWGTRDLADNEAFLQFFKGLYVITGQWCAASLPGAAPVLQPARCPDSKLTLYYRTCTSRTRSSFDFLINANCVRYTVSA